MKLSANQIINGRLRVRQERFAALARQLADEADAGRPYAHVLHELILERHLELTGKP